MTDQQHPITPPPELVQEWVSKFYGQPVNYLAEGSIDLAARAAQYGADQELEACCEWMRQGWDDVRADKLRAARRPKPPSLKQQAIVALYAIAVGANDMREQNQDIDTIRRALEQLPE